MKAKIAEIFESIQGEGIYLGERQVFLRFFGCNLTCKFCDTQLKHYLEYESEFLLEELKRYHKTASIAFTGGEPLLQKDFLKEFLPLCRKNNLKVYLETNGTLPEALGEIIDYVNVVAMDVKLPSSTGLAPFWDTHRLFLKIAQQKDVFVKTIIGLDTTAADLQEVIRLLKDVNSALVLVLQPNSFDDQAQLRPKLDQFKDQCILEGIATCIIPQMHKVLGVK
ncbi:MAG TPA: 7-carboxy-7-deazaguanine synthase QueE [Candidatus Omnitrophota bacterium]|nr:7-carboxy-7-deazaguanine synthase QueE [Candidatus Omnitrophota bacterium]